MQKNKIMDTADKLVSMLLDRGFILQRYDAYSTNSIYLKLDYGVSNSIRISDHKGKKHLNYRYNIMTSCRDPYKENREFQRYYFPISQAKELIDLIEEERIQKIRRYGTKNYFKYMERNKEEGKTLPGFWQQAKLIERKGIECF